MAAQALKLVLYKHDASPPSAAIMILADILGLKFDYKIPNLMKLENKSEEFKKKINPIGTVPVLQEGDFFLAQSHAIIKYLLAKYGGEHQEKLYPSDLRTRATIDQCLFFDASILFIRLKVVALPTLLHGMAGPSAQHLSDIEEAYSVLEAYLQKNEYIAGDHFTIADISLGTTTVALQEIHKLDSIKFPRSVQWLALFKKGKWFQNVSGGFALFGASLKASWEKNNK